METKEWKTINKTGWERGPWDNEPDKVQWQDAATGMPCLAVRQPESGHWCGYVGVPEEHPAFGRNYDDVYVEVHGGLTYSDFCQANVEAEAICHVPEAGEPENVYWLGFDCHHSGDLGPGMDAKLKKVDPTLTRSLFGLSSVYRTLDYVKAECRSLAKQLQSPELKIA